MLDVHCTFLEYMVTYCIMTMAVIVRSTSEVAINVKGQYLKGLITVTCCDRHHLIITTIIAVTIITTITIISSHLHYLRYQVINTVRLHSSCVSSLTS